ncbi:uncharacterized protein PV07_05293 [Cladophialophora immunda]|uniref:Apc15p protein n=1 Tax=Cladophialophora immunda TaxID=569365 RepID=A0A0D2D139_9EURO|nr:uncharacterized protein PV07_05293 [Cladophialophora immunda]KIW29479.1 hypothetical protein PV07_05293 [Cladophialophora immunda]
MFLTCSLPLLPPPPTSLLPPLTTSFSSEASSTASHQHPHQHPSSSRRPKPHHTNINSRNNTLVTLSSDERTISQRKMAIAMYGYSWLKPAGCAKTMLGRREEEVEREEVERQLREVELQERLAQEAEEQERLARLNEMGEGEMDEGERDLDEDIPDADEADMDGEEDGESEDEDGDGIDEGEDDEAMQADLDDDIPDADDQDDDDEDDDPMSPDPAGADGNWVYDTRREPDTDDEEQLPHPHPTRRHSSGRAAAGRYGRHATVAGVRLPVPGSEYGYDERDAEDLADAMLAHNEIFDDRATEGSSAANIEHDLDDDVPEAEDDQIWEHTDTELEESEMDISILPGQGAGPIVPGMAQAQNLRPLRSSDRISVPRSSGPWITGPSPSPHVPGEIITRRGMHARPTPDAATRAARIVSGNRQRHYHPGLPNTRHQLNQTPAMLDSPLDVDEEEVDTDVELDTPDPFAAPRNLRDGAAGRMAGPETTGRDAAPRPAEDDNNNHSPSRAAAARNWLDGAAAAVVGGSGSARRTLFHRATRRRNNVEPDAMAASGAVQAAPGGASSGGLFTPSPHIGGAGSGRVQDRPGGTALDWDTPVNANAMGGAGEGPSGQGPDQRGRGRRTGRFLGARRRAE